MEANSFGYWLRLKRKSLDLTREELAERVGYSAATIRKIEDEERRPSTQIVEQLAELFKIPQGQRPAFLHFARGDWQAVPQEGNINAPWLSSTIREREAEGVSNPKVHLATFLFTDIEGSAKLWEQAPEKMKVALQRHHDILEEAITSNHGAVFQIVGDAFCAAFPTVQSAILAVVQAQRQLHQEPWDTPLPIRVRMGIHTGEAERSSNPSLLGGYASNQTLNRVARILSAAHGGQVLLSLATKDLVKDFLPANTELRDMGEHYLKNLISPEHLFQLVIAGLPSDFPPLNTLTHRHNLPVQVTSFIAREQEMNLIHEYLSKDNIRLVTLIGPPGIGKTRLSIEAARAALQDFPDGVFFVALAPLESPALIPVTVAQALGYMEIGNISIDQQLKESIGDKKILIVLDNCEHLIEGVASLTSQLLSDCSHLKILASSRESMRIPGEWLYPVPAFDAPTENLSVNLQIASNFPALLLFAERARAVRPDFKLTADNIQMIAAICAHLDGLPLVIELIAARMRLMSPGALLERLSSQFVLTADGMRAPSERQKTLRNAIDWSYKLLSAQEQKLFAYLSVFSGGFTLETAESMFSRSVKEKSVAELVTSLLDKSLLQRDSDRESRQVGVGRSASAGVANPTYTMLVTIQGFAQDRLREMGEEAEARNWHLAYFSELARQARPHLRSTEQLALLDRLEMEHDNIRAALAWAQASGAITAGLYLATDLEMFWIYRDYLREPCLTLENLLAASLPTDQIHALSRGHLVAGLLQMFLGNHELANAHAEECERFCLQLGPTSKADLADARNLLVYTGVNFMNDPIQARQALEQNLKLFQEARDRWQVAHTIFNIGQRLRQIGDYVGARQAHEQSLALFRECGDQFRVSLQNMSLAGLAFEEGKYTEARPRLEEAISYRRQVRFNHEMDATLYMLGAIAIREGDYARAKAWYTECLLFDKQIGVRTQLAECLIGFAGIANAEKRFERAARLLSAAEAEVEARRVPLDKTDRAELKRLTTILGEEMGDPEFEALVAEDRTMTIDQVIEYALETYAST